jgi:hypothetical protein
MLVSTYRRACRRVAFGHLRICGLCRGTGHWNSAGVHVGRYGYHGPQENSHETDPTLVRWRPNSWNYSTETVWDHIVYYPCSRWGPSQIPVHKCVVGAERCTGFGTSVPFGPLRAAALRCLTTFASSVRCKLAIGEEAARLRCDCAATLSTCGGCEGRSFVKARFSCGTLVPPFLCNLPQLVDIHASKAAGCSRGSLFGHRRLSEVTGPTLQILSS